MGMLYEYEGFENLFETGTCCSINAEYLEEVSNGHKVRIRWYPEAIDNNGQIKIVKFDDIIGSRNNGSIIQLLVEYFAYHREDYHIIQIVSPESGIDDMLVHRSLFNIEKKSEEHIIEYCGYVQENVSIDDILKCAGYRQNENTV